MKKLLQSLFIVYCFFVSTKGFTQQPNDNCANAVFIPTSSTCFNTYSTVVGATNSGIAVGACTGTPDDDVWFKFVAAKPNPTITLSSLGTGTPSITSAGPRMQLFSGTCGAFTSLACGTTSITASGLTVSNTYYVRVYTNAAGAPAANGQFNICITDPGPPDIIDSTNILFTIDTICKNLGYPWEILRGPDDSLWITEARGYRVVRIAANRTQASKNIPPQQILKIPLGTGEVNFLRGPSSGPFVANEPETYGRWPQGGMMGMALHPLFGTDPTKQFVYLAYVFKQGTCPNSNNPCFFNTKIVQCRFYYAADAGNPSSLPKKDTLVIIDTVMSNLSGSNDHNSGRMVISPFTEADGTYKLYYSIGDMGAGQFNNTTRTHNGQNKDVYEGKILRLNTQRDADAPDPNDPFNQWIPNDNPFTFSPSVVPATLSGKRSAVFTYGHRNPQGLVWANVNGTWKLYSSEHGDRSDDEINILVAGKNYGWPKVAGLCDDNYSNTDIFANNDQLASVNIPNEIASFCNVTPDNTEPIFSFFNWSGGQLHNINTGNNFSWPTIAPSSIDYYDFPPIAGGPANWNNSLLVTSLKYGLFRLKLKSDGNSIDSSQNTKVFIDTFPLFHGWRVRDITFSKRGASIYAAIDSSGSTSGPTGGFGGANTNTLNAGTILRFRFASTPLPIKEEPGQQTTRNNPYLKVFPNPASAFLYVDNKKNVPKPFTYYLYDITGRLIKTGNNSNNNFSVNISGIKPGMYIFRLFSSIEAELLTERIIIQ
ncbi:MAG: T9SS type A sorting domain-containing protein [Sphingobacteriales bacterium]|nr:MAG: T9SS type A sorting domain-containing protein [Sphingobacteriales bacterium]